MIPLSAVNSVVRGIIVFRNLDDLDSTILLSNYNILIIRIIRIIAALKNPFTFFVLP